MCIRGCGRWSLRNRRGLLKSSTSRRITVQTLLLILMRQIKLKCSSAVLEILLAAKQQNHYSATTRACRQIRFLCERDVKTCSALYLIVQPQSSWGRNKRTQILHLQRKITNSLSVHLKRVSIFLPPEVCLPLINVPKFLNTKRPSRTC